MKDVLVEVNTFMMNSFMHKITNRATYEHLKYT